mgnify:CR=1 FL=1
MSVQLLDKTRKINKLLHNNNSHKVVFNDICEVLSNILLSNVLVISRKGKVLGIKNRQDIEVIDELINNENEEKKDFIKWVDFKITYDVLDKTSKLDINSHVKNEEIKYNWIELLAYLACKNGGDFKKFKQTDLDDLIKKIKNGQTIGELTQNMKYYNYYFESYSAVLSGFIGDYKIETTNEDGQKIVTEKYGIKAFLPIAKNYGFSHYDDFGNSRSYGFKRTHLGNDLMGSIGTPIVAVESGTIEHIGWNQYGGWRIGIRSFDKKRYYYYAHLRKNHPYSENMQEGKTVKAGDVIGYLGMTGYSLKENVNNINIPHLHFGMQLIFDKSQEDGNNEIWIDVYQIIEFLKQNQSEVYIIERLGKYYKDTKDYVRKNEFYENAFFE